MFGASGYSQLEVQNGPVRILYPNGQISSEGIVKDGKPDGIWKTYYVTGILKSEGKRTNFNLDSTWNFYNQSGELKEVINESLFRLENCFKYVKLKQLFVIKRLFVIIVLRTSNLKKKDDSTDALSLVSSFKITSWLLIGGTSLYFGSDWLVKGAVVIAKEIGVSEAVISVSIIAFGTSIPELAASVMAVVRNEKSISLGNLIGSNIFNIGSVLGLTAIIKPIVVDDPLIVSRDLIWMLIFAVILLPLSLILKRNQFRKTEGFTLVFIYGIFIYNVFMS
mgnify:CR=1 FL=1